MFLRHGLTLVTKKKIRLNLTLISILRKIQHFKFFAPRLNWTMSCIWYRIHVVVYFLLDIFFWGRFWEGKLTKEAGKHLAERKIINWKKVALKHENRQSFIPCMEAQVLQEIFGSFILSFSFCCPTHHISSIYKWSPSLLLSPPLSLEIIFE